MCAENASSFELRQLEHLQNSRTCVYQLRTNPEYGQLKESVVMTKGTTFSGSKEENRATLQSFRERNYELVSYNLTDNCIGIVDLAFRGKGITYQPGALVAASEYTEVDAAALSVGTYTGLVRIFGKGDLYYNGINCAKIESGDVSYLTEDLLSDPDMEIQSTNRYYIQLKLASKYNFAKASTIGKYTMLSQENQPAFQDIVNLIYEIPNETVKNNISAAYQAFCGQVSGFLRQSKVKAETVLSSQGKVLVDAFITSLDTVYSQLSEGSSEKEKIFTIIKIFYEVLLGTYIETDNPNYRESPYAREKEGGGPLSELPIDETYKEDSARQIIEESAIILEPNQFGYYISIENSEFILRPINTEEEFLQIKDHGYIYRIESEPEQQQEEEALPLEEVKQFETPEFDANKQVYGFDALGPQSIPPLLGREGAGAGGNSTRRKRQGKNKHYRTKGRRNNKRNKTLRNKPVRRNNFTQKDMVM
jgi:hypothetical protein